MSQTAYLKLFFKEASEVIFSKMSLIWLWLCKQGVMVTCFSLTFLRFAVLFAKNAYRKLTSVIIFSWIWHLNPGERSFFLNDHEYENSVSWSLMCYLYLLCYLYWMRTGNLHQSLFFSWICSLNRGELSFFFAAWLGEVQHCFGTWNSFLRIPQRNMRGPFPLLSC